FMKGLIAASLAIVVGAFASEARAIDITACGQAVPAGQIGVLMGDLDCGSRTEEPSYGVALENRAALDLNGHTITGPRYGVYCPVACRIIGPGTITGAYYGIWALDSKRGRADVFEVAVVANVGGIAAYRGNLTNVTATDNSLAMDVRKLRGTNLTVTGCGGSSPYCIGTAHGKVDGLTATGNTVSLAVFQVIKSLSLESSTMSGNSPQIGILPARRLQLENSDVSGHGVDLVTGSRPRLTASTCGASARLVESDPPWGICAND